MAKGGQHSDDRLVKNFMKHVLSDLRALEQVIAAGKIERGVRRVGAEQEMFLVDDALRPAPVNQEVLDRADDKRMTTELGRFNLEANCSPQAFGGTCLSDMEAELSELVRIARVGANLCGAEILLTGILPTLRQADLNLESMTPNPRYAAMDRSLTRLRGGQGIHVQIKGMDDLDLTHDNVMLEACNTSFQIHFQVGAEEFAKLYNLAQAVSAPVLAAAVNSPLLMGHRLWHETRVALFQRSVEERSSARQLRGTPPRVHFGFDWIRDSVVEIFKEDIAHYRLILADSQEEDPLAVVAAGGVPELTALRLHNSTVWRWNRACYGVNPDGKTAHLRIENRVLPAGPSVLDEIANAAFFFGLMSRIGDEYGDISQALAFDDAKRNFFAAAQSGLQAQFTWVNSQKLSAERLILDHLLPIARAGLRQSKIVEHDIDRYLDVIEARVRSNQTGAQWVMSSIPRLGKGITRDVRDRTIVAAMLSRQRAGGPVHEWALADPAESRDWRHSYRTVGQFMTTNLFTVHPDDIVDLAASLMEWEHIRHVPVENDDGMLVGLVSHRDLLRLVSQGRYNNGSEPPTVAEIMHTDPVTVKRSTNTLDAARVMRSHRVGCLPVVDDNGRLQGIVTQHDLLEVSYQLLETYLTNQN